MKQILYIAQKTVIISCNKSHINMVDIKSIFDYLQLLLRYFVSGVIAVLTITYIDKNSMQLCFVVLQKTPWVLLLVAATIGITLNAIHHAIFDDLFLSFSLRLYRIKHNIPDILQVSIAEWRQKSLKNYSKPTKKIKAINFGLFSQTYLRRKSANNSIISLESELNKKWSVLNLLYCSFYSMWLVPILISSKHLLNNSYHIDVLRIKIIFIFGFIILIAALVYDYKITKREMWIAVNFFQPILSNEYRTINFKLQKSKSPIEAPYLTGDFNEWDETSHRMIDDNNGFWTISHKFPCGEIRYAFIVNGTYINDPERDGSSHDGKSLRWID